MGNHHATPPAPTNYIPKVEVVLNSSEPCTFKFNYGQHINGANIGTCDVEKEEVRGRIPNSTKSVKIITKTGSTVTVGIEVGECCILLRNQQAVCIVADTRKEPWCFTYYGERIGIKLINESSHNITITRADGDPLVVIPLSYMEAKKFVSIVTHRGKVVDVRSCYYAHRDGTVGKHHHYTSSGLVFDCDDSGDCVMVTVKDEVGG